MEIEADFASLDRRCLTARVVEESLVRYHSRRFSQRQPDRAVPVDGLLGAFVAEGELSDLAPFLVIAGSAHLGSHAALGQGRVRVALWP